MGSRLERASGGSLCGVEGRASLRRTPSAWALRAAASGGCLRHGGVSVSLALIACRRGAGGVGWGAMGVRGWRQGDRRRAVAGHEEFGVTMAGCDTVARRRTFKAAQTPSPRHGPNRRAPIANPLASPASSPPSTPCDRASRSIPCHESRKPIEKRRLLERATPHGPDRRCPLVT